MQTRRKARGTNDDQGSNQNRNPMRQGKVPDSKQGVDKEEIMNDIQLIQSALPTISADIAGDQVK